MSETINPKNGVPCFDSSGVMSVIPQDDVCKPFGFSVKNISFQESANSNPVMILISDLGTYPVAQGFSRHGFSGICFKSNDGVVYNGFGTAVVNAVASYFANSAEGMCLNTTFSLIAPCVVKYNGHVYVAIKVKGNSGGLRLVGTFFNLLDTPIILNNRNGMNSTDAEVLFDCSGG